MTNAELFEKTFGRFATELWAMPERYFCEWLKADAEDMEARKKEGEDKKMTRQKAIEIIKNYKVEGCGYCHQGGDEVKEAFKMAIKALEQKPCGDCISRQAVLAIAGDSCLDLDSYDDTKEFCDEIKALPPVTPYPKTEKCEWIRYDYRTICPQNHDIYNPYWRIPEKRMNALKYCPYCGKEIEVTE